MGERRALLVGAGGMGRAWARNLRDTSGVELAGWVDRDPQVIETSLNALHLEVDYKGVDYAKALEDLQPDIVVDVTTPESHYEITVAALERGIPVLGEKPLSSSMEQARKMVQASADSGKLYMVSQSRRYDPRIRAYRRLVERLGPLGMLNADFFIGPHFGGFREEMGHVLLVDMAIHTFDQARFLSNSDPVSVYCEEFNPDWSWYRGAASAFANFEMTGGLRFSYRGSWCAEGQPTSWESEWRAVGAKGSGTWDGDHAMQGEIVKVPGGFLSDTDLITERAVDDANWGIAGSLRDFVAALDNPDHVPMGRCDDNIKSLAMVFAAVRSSLEGRRVEIAELLTPSDVSTDAR